MELETAQTLAVTIFLIAIVISAIHIATRKH
jgi:hypothetical protein